MDKLKFYEYYSFIPVPDKLKDDLLDSEEQPLTKLENLSHINIFLGTNNSGKSRIIREIIRKEITPVFINKETQKKLSSVILNTKTTLQQWMITKCKQHWVHLSEILITNNFVLRSGSYLFSIPEYDKLFNARISIIDQNKNMEELLKKLKTNTFDHLEVTGATSMGLAEEFSTQYKNIFIVYLQPLKELLSELLFKENFYRIYIPSQRSLKTLFAKADIELNIAQQYDFELKDLSDHPDSYNNPNGIIIETGQSFYDDILEHLTTGHKNRAKVLDYEQFLSKNFFEGVRVDLIPYTKKVKELHIKIGDEKEQAIYNLGDGLQMLIIMTWPFFNFENGIIAIEEPELFIHPGLQKKLIEIFATHKKAQNFIFFISTHSNHIVDAIHNSKNISTFTVRKKFEMFFEL